MDVVFAHEDFPETVRKTIFLAGPTPREAAHSWRADALSELEKLCYDGTVFIPEPRDGKWTQDYTDQLEWEEEGLNRADCIVFWVPRDIDGNIYGCPMPGLTTNDEWGVWKNSGKVVWGCPSWAQNVRYQEHYASKYNVPVADTLTGTLQNAMEMVGDGAIREKGFSHVPLYIWKRPEFADWVLNMTMARNRLCDCRVVSTNWNPDHTFMFAYSLWVDIYIAKENRNKSNEIVFFRPDVVTAVLYYPRADIGEIEIVLVREFRSPVSNRNAFVYELPGGSSKSIATAKVTALHEIEEETGLKLSEDRLKRCEQRQNAATLSAYSATLFSAELTDEEIQRLRAGKDQPHGVEGDSERTWVEVWTLRAILENNLMDWANLGMIFSALQKEEW